MKFIDELGLQESDFTDMVDAAKVDYPGWHTEEIQAAIQARIIDLIDWDDPDITSIEPVDVAQSVRDMAAAVTAAACITAQEPPPDFMEGFMAALDDIAVDLIDEIDLDDIAAEGNGHEPG